MTNPSIGDVLFDTLAAWHGGRPWGRVLDAGTGDKSLEWILSLGTSRWTAVTGEPERAQALQARVQPRMRPGDEVLAGNWTDPQLLDGQRYDVVLADYLLGAIDGHAPYFQDQLFGRLRPHVGGVLYAIGQSPMPDIPQGDGQRLILEAVRLRDACILLAGDRCYREYPLPWVERHLQSAGYVITARRELPMILSAAWVERQLAVGRRKLPRFQDPGVAREVGRHLDALTARARAHPELRAGVRIASDWMVAAELG